ncbi:MAG: hypothetical protein GY751_05170 [Bacteroidetes bacterium]|nr:hypothetical protein [Bacteroidota bacterium]
MRRLPYLFIFLALSIMSCKSGEKTSNGTDSVSNNIIISKTDTEESTGDDSQEGGSDYEDQVAQRQKMTESHLVGQWVWVQTSCCGRTSRDIFPEEGSEKRIITFMEDGKVLYFTRGEGNKLEEHPFVIGKLGTQATVKIGELQPALFYVNENELSLSWGYMDLQIEYYQRVGK